MSADTARASMSSTLNAVNDADAGYRHNETTDDPQAEMSGV